MRKNSVTYSKWFGDELSAENHKQIWVSPWLVHGFLVMSPTAQILYKTSDYYHPQGEVCLAWNDLDLGINWLLPSGVEPILSAKDTLGVSLNLLNSEVWEW